MNVHAMTCPNCGAALPANAPGGHCLSCLLRIGLAVADGGLAQGVELSDPSSMATDPEQTSAPPRIRYVGDYELLRELGRGGMGVVYEARQASLNRIVALKLVRAGEFAEVTEVARFRAEAEAAAQLDHPHIVPIYEVGEHEGRHYFSMKLIEGGTLSERICNLKSPISNREAASLLATISRAVHYAHQRGLLHRDLKPGNILLDALGQPHVTDFGLAKRIEGDSSMTMSGAILGTPNYIAPEQAKGTKQLTTGADIYSLGAILYELLTGRPPFLGATVMETLQKVMNEEPVPPSTVRRSQSTVAAEEIDRDLETIGLKCLEKDPARRYGSAEALAEDLERWQRREPIRARPVSTAERFGKWTRRNPLLAGSFVTIFVVAIAGLAGIVWQWRAAVAARGAAEKATVEKQEQVERLWQSQFINARHYRTTGTPGQRTKALEVIEAAVTVRPSVELRSEALSALMLPDLGTQQWWKAEQSFEHPWCFDSTLAHYLPHADFPLGATGRLVVRHSVDHRIAADLGAIPRQPSAAAFSPDGRWLAVVLADGRLTVWDWRNTNRVASVRSSHETLRARGRDPWGWRCFDFSPDSRTFYFGDTGQGIGRIVLSTGTVTPAISTGSASLVRVSPSGKLLLATRVNEVEIWEIDPPRRLVATNLSSFPAHGLLGAAWHPNEQLIALGVLGGLHLWHWRSGTQHSFGPTPPSYPHCQFFNRTGDLLFVDGTVWDVATQRPLLTLELGSVLAVSENERHVALSRYRTGFGAWEFLPPVGTRVLMESRFTGLLPRPDPSPDGRWLASVHHDGWRLWDVASGRLMARGPEARASEARFTTDGKALITLGTDGLKRWPLPESRTSILGSRIIVGPEELILAGLPPTSITNQPFAADLPSLNQRPGLKAERGTITRGAGFAALNGNGQVMVVDISRMKSFPPIRLLNRNDVEFTLSPDGRWLVTGQHNRREQDLWDVKTGRHMTKITSPTFPACFFTTDRGQLASWNSTEFILRESGSWRELQRFPWPADGPLVTGLFPGSIAPDGRTMWCGANDGQISLLDSASRKTFARLERPGGMSANSMGFDASGENAYVGTAQNAIRHIELRALRRELARLGLDWPDENPGEGFAPRR